MEIKVESYYQKFLQDNVKKIEEENRKRRAEEEEEKRKKEEEEKAIQANLEEAINYAKNYLTEDQEYYVNTMNSDNYSTLQKLAFKKAFEDGDIDGAKSYIDSINKDKELLAKQTNKQDLARIETTSNLLRDLHKDNYPAQVGIGMVEAVQKFFNLNENKIDGGGWFQGEQKRKDKADHASYLALQNKYEQPIKEFYTKEIDNKITALGYNPDENIKLQQLRQWDMNVNNPYRTEEEKREWKDSREDRRAAYTAAKVLYKAKKDLNHYLDNQKFDWFSDFGYSFGNEMVQVLTLGVDDAKSQLYKAKLESKMRKDGYESLSDNEKAVIDAYSVLDDVNQTVATNKGLGDALGQLTANSVGFMAQMGLANKVVGGTLKATGRAIAKNTEKQSIKNTIEFLEKTSSKEAAKQYITKGGKKASYSAYAANRGAYWTTVGALAAPLQPMTWSAAGEMYSGAWTTIKGKDGEVDRIITDQKSANDFITTELESIYTLSNYAEKIVEQMQTAAGAEATASDFEVNNEIYDIMFSDKYADLRKNAFGDDLTKTFNELGYGSKSLALLYRLVEENILEHQANIELIGDPNNPENPYYDVSFGKSYGKGYIDQVYENWSETLVGSTFDEAVHGAKVLFKIGKKAEVNAAKSGFHPISKLIRGGKDIGSKLPSFKGVINSLPGEATEEYVRNFMYNPLGTEQEWKDQLKENTTADFALQTVLSTALISAGGAVFNKALQITNGTNNVYNQIMAINNATERLGALAEAFKNGDISEKDFNNSILNLLNPTKRNRASLQAVLSDLQKLEASGRNVSQAKKLMESIGLLSYITNSQTGQENSILENIKKGLEREATAQGLSSIEDLKSYKNFYSIMLNTSSWVKKINKLKEEGKFVSDKHEDDVRQLLYQKKLYDILGANYADSIKESLKATEHGSTLSDEQLDSVVAKIIAAKDSEEFDKVLEPFNLKNKEKKNFETFKAIESVIGDRQNKLTEQFNLRMDLDNDKSIKDLKDFYQVEEKDAKNSAAETRQSIAEEIPTITDARENTEIKDKKERRSLKKATTEVPIGGLIEYNGKVKRKTKTGSLSNNVGEISNGEFVYRYKKDKQGNFIRDVEEIHLSTEDQATLNNTNVEEIAQQSNLSAEELARRSYEEDMYDNFYAPVLDDEEISEAEKEVLKRMYLPYIKSNRLSFEEVVHLPGTSLNKAQYKYLREEILKDNDIDQFTKEKWTRLDNNKMNSVLNSFVKSALQAVAEEKQDRVNDKNQNAAEKIKKVVQQGSAVKDVGLMKINIVPQAIPQGLAGSPITLSIDKNWNDGTKVVTVGNKRWNFLELLSKIGIDYTKFENLTFEEIKEKVAKGEITEKEFVKFMGIVPLQGDTQKGTLTNVFPNPNDINYNEKFLLVNGIVRHCFEIIKGLQRKGLNVSGLYDSLNDFRNNVEVSGDVEPAIKILATALKESDIDISEIISGLRNVARNTANSISKIRTQVAKTGTYTLTINETAMIAPEVEEKEKPFSEIKDSELRFCCYQKAQDGLVDLQTKEKLYPEQILSYKDVMIKVVEGKGFALVKTGRKVTVSKNDANGKPVAKEVDEYYVLYTDTRIQYNDVDKPQQIGLVKSMVNTLVFIKELCNHDFNSGFFRTEFNGKTVVVTPQNANTVFQKLFDILEFGNAASERKKENLLGYVNKISQTLVPEGYGDSKQIMSKLGPAYYTRISFKTLGNEHLIVPIISVDENGNVDSQLSEPLTVRDFRLQVLGTKAKIVDGKVSITPTLTLSDNSKPVQQEETPTPPTQDIVDESEEEQKEDEVQEEQEDQEEQDSEEEKEESEENEDEEEENEEESIEEEEEDLIEPKDVIDENANLRSYQGIVSYLQHDVFSRMALVDKFKVTDIYKEAQKSLDKLIKSLPIGSNVRSFLEANRRDILGVAPGSRYVGSLRQIVDEFFDIRKSLTDDYTAEVLDYEYEDDGSKNFETIYGTQSFEKDINVNLSKRTKMLLSSVPKTTIDENGNIVNVKKEGLKTFENYNDILFALQEAISNSSDHTVESAIRYMEEKIKNATTGLYIEDNNKNEVHLKNGYEIFKNAVIVLKKLVEDSHKGDSIQNKLKREIEYMLNQNQVTMSFVYAITNTRVTFDEFTGEPTKKETKNISVQDANRRRAVEIKKDKIRLNFRNLLKFDEDLQSYVYDIDKLRELKSLIQKFKTTYQTGDVKRSVDNAGIVYKEAFNDLKRIFEILGIDINDNTVLDLFKHTEKGKGLLEIKNVNKGISRGNYGDIIRYLSNLIGDDGQITEILNAEDNNIKFLVGYTGGDFCTWRKYNTETKSIDKNTLHRPILAYNGKGNSGISLVLDILERDDKYTFTPIPNIYINKKRISAFEQKRFINRQMDLIKEGLKQGLEDVPENSRASKLIENLKRTPFAKYSFLLNIIERHRDHIDKIGIEWSSLESLVLKGKEAVNDNTSLVQVSDKDKITAFIGYFTDGFSGTPLFTDNGYDYYVTRFTFPALSDASVLPILKSLAINFSHDELRLSKDGNTFNSGSIKELLYEKLVKGELLRIISYYAAKARTNVAGLDNGSKLFTLIPALNAVRKSNEDGSSFSITDLIKESIEQGNTTEQTLDIVQNAFGDIIKDTTSRVVINQAEDLYKDLAVNGIIQETGNNGLKLLGQLDSNFLNRYKKEKESGELNRREKVHDLCLSYTINSMLAQSDIYKLFVGDLACYNTDKLPKFMTGDVTEIDSKGLVDFYINNYVNSEKAELYKEALDNDDIFSNLKTKEKKEVIKLRRLQNINSEEYEKALEIAYGFFIEEILQKNLNKRLKGLISPGNVLSEASLANSFKETYQIMLEDVNSVSGSIDFYYKIFYKNTDKLSKLEKKDIEEKINLLKNYEKKDFLTEEEKIKFKTTKKELIQKLPDIADYFDIADTDGQEYTTWKNHLQQLLLRGQITDAEYDQIASKLKSQTELNEINSSNRLSSTELRLALMQPTKPVHFGMYFKEVGEGTENYLSQNMVFVKSSSFPLIPQLTLGFEDIDKLRTVMEKLQTEDRTVRVSYNTGNKVGGLSSAMTFDQVIELADDSDLETKLSNTMVVLDQANYSIQQDKPFDTFENLDEGLRDEIPRSTQMEKSILANGISKIKEKIFPAKKFSLQTLKVLGLVDENMTKEELKSSNLMISGQDLYNIYDYLYQKEQDILKKKLLAKLNIADLRDVDSAIFKKSIQRLLTQRLTNSQDIEGIELYHKFDIIEDGKLKHYELDDKQWENLSEEVREKVSNYSYDFNINPWVLPNVKKFESVLNNIIADASIRLKFPGSHGIVASQKGFKTNLVGQDEYKGDVIFADDFDGELKAVRDVDGKLKAAQVFVANKFRKFNPKTNKYELIDLRQYTIIKDGKTYLDPERVPEEVREMFSLRIPVSLHQSGMRIEIAGFLPTECGDLMIVPKDSVTQMGEDFDIDVRYYYQANITETPEVRDENGNVTEKTKLQLVEPIDNNEPISEQIRKNYFDYLKTVDDRIIDKTDPWYQEYGLDYLMQHAILISEDKQYKKKHLDDLKESGATDETIKNIEKLASLIRNSKYKTDLQKYIQQLKREEIEYQCIENDLMGIYKSVYASENPLVQQKITKVLNTAFLEDTVNVLDNISGRKNYANSTPLSTLKQIDLLNKGNTGKVGIGVWSALEVFISLLQQCQNPVKFNSDWHLGNFHWDGTIGGYYNEETYSYECLKPENAKKGFKNRTIADIIVECQNSATDNIKKQIMARRNENEYTFPVYEMFALTGMDKDGFAVDGVELSYPSIFMTQPIIKRYVELCAQNDSLTTQDRVKDKELVKMLRDEFMTKIWKDKKGKVHRDMAKMEELTGETLFENLQRPNNLVQQTVLSVFLNFKDKFNELRPYITKLNLEQKGLGVSFFDTIDKYHFILDDATSTNNETVTGLNQLVGEKFYVRSNNVTESNEETQELEPVQQQIQQQQSLPGPETKINIYAGTSENADLSNFAVRPFKFAPVDYRYGDNRNETEFTSVEQAFQYYKMLILEQAADSLNYPTTTAGIQDLRKTKTTNRNAILNIADSILKTKTASSARSIGRQPIPLVSYKVTLHTPEGKEYVKTVVTEQEIKDAIFKVYDTKSSALMKDLIKASFEQNPQALQRLLATGNATLTHTQDKGKWGKEFPKLLMEVREELREENSQTGNRLFPKVEVFNGYWTREQVANQQDKVFLFGDNTNDRVSTHYVPSSTQAVIRGLSNAIGIDTKKDRGTGANSYFSDDDFDQFKAQVDSALNAAKADGRTIVIPADGIGTGKAMLKEKAPKCFEYLQSELQKLQQNSLSSIPVNSQNNIDLIVTESLGDYAQRTEENADWSDITIAFATEFDTLGERLTAQVAGSKDKKYLGDRKPKENVPDKYAPVNILQTGNIDLPMLNNAIEKAKALGKPIKLNIAGNGIYTLAKSGITQEQINNEIQFAIQYMLDNGVQIEEIRSGGQTGIDEAGIVAALRLGIPASVHAPKGFKFRDVDNKDISNQEKFLSRFANVGNIVSGETKKDSRNVITDEAARKMNLVYFGTQNGYDIYIKPNGFYAHKIVNSISEGYNLWKNIFPYDDNKMIRMIYGVLESSNVDPSTKKGLELKYKILESIQDYVYSTLSCHSFCGNNPDILRRRFFIQDNHNESFAAYIQRLMNKPEYKNSVFFKNLMFNYDLDTKIFTMTYNMNAEGLGEKSQIYEMFREMATSEKELDSWNGMPMSESLLMRYLTQYSFFISGNMNYRKYIPLDVFNTIITTNVNTGNSINLKDELNFKTKDVGLTMTFASYMDQMEDFLGSHKGSFESEIKNSNGLPISLIEKRVNKINDQCGKIVFILDSSTGNVKINNKYKFNEAHNIKFVDKFFQHNPEIAYKADNDEFVKYIKDDIPLTLPVDVCVNKSGMPKSYYIHFNYNDNIYLYKMNLDTFEFYRLNLLGNKVMTEYSTTRNASLINSNNIVSVSTESSEEKSVMSWLNEILATPQNKNYALAEYLKPFAKNVDIAYENFNGAMRYRKEDNTIVINPIRVNKLSTGEAQEKLLHELLHACTTKILQENIKGNGKGVTFERGTDGKFTAKIEIAENAPIQIHNLIRVYKDAVVALQDDSPIGKIFKEMLNLYVDKINRGESVNNLTELKKRVLEKYPELKDVVENSTFFSSYYLTNPYEFIAGIFFAPELVSKLNTIPASSKSDMTLIERFARALKKILDAIGNIVAGSEAESVVNDIISIINMSNEESTDIINETENVENEQENEEATTLDSDVRSVKEFQGEMSDKNPEWIKWLLEHPDNRSLEELLDLDAPIIDEHDFSLGDRVTIKGTQYRLLEVGEDSNFKYAVSKVNGMYKISTIQGGVFVTPTYFQHPDFTSLLHDFSKICDTFAKNGIDVFENPYLFENNNKQNYNEENINLNYC